ncbi:MAG: hypothetical protein O3A00_06660 [Planctomycetota bacterium]|nr:hypothetical protein [Planctomycetota bacterium]
MSKCKRAALALMVVLGMSLAANAGEITGIVKFKDGSLGKGIGVSGLTAGLLGGVTGKVFTNNQGKFRLTWSSNSGLAKVYVKGSTVARNVKNGAFVELTVP